MSQLPTSLQMVTGVQIGDIIRFFLFRKLYPNKMLTLSELWDALESDVPDGESFRVFNTMYHLAGWLGLSAILGRNLTISGNSVNPNYSLTDNGREYVEEEAARQGISLKEVPKVEGLPTLSLCLMADIGNHGSVQMLALVSRLNESAEAVDLPKIDVMKVCHDIQPAIQLGMVTAIPMNRGGSLLSLTPSGLGVVKRWIELCHADGFLLEVPVPA